MQPTLACLMPSLWSVTACVTPLVIMEQTSVAMQVVDMFGCGLPVCAASYDCIHELVKEGQTGLLFDSYQQLADQWVALFQGFPKNPSQQLLHMQQQVQQRTGNWSASWKKLIHIFA